MFKVQEVRINNFWYRLNAYCQFNDDVNIIIGRNGTGKTTFMNILHAALSVDLEELASSDFDKIEIKLVDGNKKKTVKVEKINNQNSPFQPIEYQISNKKFRLRGVPQQDDRVFPSHYKRMALEQASELRHVLNKIVSLASLSVYRLRSGDDFEIKDRSGRRLMSPVDFRLSQLKTELTQYQFELSQKARIISTTLQKDVLASILYSDSSQSGYVLPKQYEKSKERTKLLAAYSRLGAVDQEVRKKISVHTSAIDEALIRIHDKNKTEPVNFAALEAFDRTKAIIEMSLKAEEETKSNYSQIELFIQTLKEFIDDKLFTLDSGELLATNLAGDQIPSDKLSSGEKQLLILLIESLLQKNKPFVYLTDEPELSLHIEWQRNIIPAIKRINPHAQIIAATHSPEVASKYKSSLIDMKAVTNG